MILKLDLVKAFDRVNWTFLRLVLLHIGIPFVGVNWILGCVETSNFVVLVNGIPSKFFLASRGIKQGCPLSPLLFILIIESLSMLIHDAQQRGVITGVKITSSLFLTHLLFVDDVLLFGEATVDEWQQYKQLLDLFYSATGMQINEKKSILLFNDIDELAKANIGAILPYKMELVS